MNINKDYFNVTSSNKKVDIDLKKNEHFTLNTFSKNNRISESIWNFSIKFGYVDTKYENIPYYENSEFNLYRQDNTAGFTFDGLSYPPYDITKPKGDIIGYIKHEIAGRGGCSFSECLKHVKGFTQFRLDIPIAIIKSFTNFNHIIYVSIDELSAFSQIHIPTNIYNNKDVTFTLYLADTNPTHNTYISSSEITFHQTTSFQKLSIDFFNPFTHFDDSIDKLQIINARINSKGYLEIVANNVHNSFTKNNTLIFPKNKLKFPEPPEQLHAAVGAARAVDAYRDATIAIRTIKGKHLYTTLSDINGLFEY